MNNNVSLGLSHTPVIGWLYTCVYNDNTSYNQPPDDKSARHPGKSAYADIDHSKLSRFILRKRGSNQHVAVNFDNGTIWVCGREVHTCPMNQIGRLKLYYWRTVQLQMVSGRSEVSYKVGFQCDNEPPKYVIVK